MVRQITPPPGTVDSPHFLCSFEKKEIYNRWEFVTLIKEVKEKRPWGGKTETVCDEEYLLPFKNHNRGALPYCPRICR